MAHEPDVQPEEIALLRSSDSVLESNIDEPAQPVTHRPRESIIAAEQREYDERLRAFLAEFAEGSD